MRKHSLTITIEVLSEPVLELQIFDIILLKCSGI